ncbi:MAG: hypothetical protein RR902_00555, partial [Oscillospiraceae bacterium]
MKKKFTVNDKVYDVPELDFNAVCDLEGMGVSFTNLKKTPILGLRAFLALCLDGDAEIAGIEIGEHMKKGGKLDVIAEAMGASIQDSDFFQALNQN